MLTKQKKEEIRDKWDLKYMTLYKQGVLKFEDVFDFWLSLLSQELEGKVDVERVREEVKKIISGNDILVTNSLGKPFPNNYEVFEGVKIGVKAVLSLPSLTSDKKEKI